MLKMISESTEEVKDDPIGQNVFRTGVQTRIFIQQINESTGTPAAHFIMSDVQSVTEVGNEEDNTRQIVTRINETLVFEANGTGEITNWTEVVGSGISNIPEVLSMLEEHLGDEFDELPAALQTNRSSELL
tara:strand:+ start:227 stop:619 length:393 start_codon:yes stop_codon:yes gene_type:complete